MIFDSKDPLEFLARAALVGNSSSDCWFDRVQGRHHPRTIPRVVKEVLATASAARLKCNSGPSIPSRENFPRRWV